MKRFVCLFLAAISVAMSIPSAVRAQLRAGAAVVDVTPSQFPVLVNGGMLSNSADRAVTALHARAIVLDDGQQRVALVVVDSCMLPRMLLDEAKQLAAQRTGIAANCMMISATHTHTAPAAMGCLGTDADPTYPPYLREKLAEAIATAEQNLEPARVGWAVANAAEFTALRRWIIRPDRIDVDPFGNRTVRANMHAGANWDNVTGESGPEDPDLMMISLQSIDGRPIALLANFSMHYFSGVPALNADYYGLFCRQIESLYGSPNDSGSAPFVAIMSHGCSGDIWRRDYTQPAPPADQPPLTIEHYTHGLVEIASQALKSINYTTDAQIKMAEARLQLAYRVPDKQRLQWAEQIVAAMGNRAPQTTEEVYAREQLILHEQQATEVVVQALRIGQIAIATTPNETYALTGLKLKYQSPLEQTMVIELANGGDGYIPPPEQHVLGGYNTWPARSAGLEVTAEPKITEAALGLLEQVTGKPRRAYRQTAGSAAEATLQAQPLAYWRLDEFAAPWARDSSPHQRHGFYEPGVVFFLEGPRSALLCQAGETNRAAHFAGGRLATRLSNVTDQYTVSLWCWNGMPADGRETAGWLYSRDRNHGTTSLGEHLGVGGTGTSPGKLIYLSGSATQDVQPAVGRTALERWTWNHVALVRDGRRVRVYLNGNPQPEIDVEVSAAPAETSNEEFFFGGRSDNHSNWEGRLDEIAVFDRVLSVEQLQTFVP